MVCIIADKAYLPIFCVAQSEREMQQEADETCHVWGGYEYFDAEEWHDIDMCVVKSSDGTRWIVSKPTSLTLHALLRIWVAVVIHPRVRPLLEW